MRLVFDRGTVLLHDIPQGLDVQEIPGLLWDPRVRLWRAPGRLAYPLASEFARRAVPLADKPAPRLEAPSGIRRPALRDYQDAALTAWRLAGRRGVIVLPTGSGKTQVAIAAMAATRAAALCLVPTRALLQQWITALGQVYGGPIGCFGDGERSLRPVTVATFASAYRHMPILGDRFGLLVVDEAHHFGQTHHDDALDMAIAPLRLGLTATPSTVPSNAQRLAALLGPVVFERQIGDLGPGALAPLDRLSWKIWFNPDEQRTYDQLRTVYWQSFRSFQARHPGAPWEQYVREGGHTDEGRRGLSAWRRARRLLAFPQGKQTALTELLAQVRDRRTLVFVADNETAYAVARQNLIMPLTCDIGRAERERVLGQFAVGDLRALVSAQVLNEGLDVPDADVGIVVAGRLGEREHLQRIGRLLRPRPGKRATLYELVVQRSSEVGQAQRRWERLAVAKRPSVAHH